MIMCRVGLLFISYSVRMVLSFSGAEVESLFVRLVYRGALTLFPFEPGAFAPGYYLSPHPGLNLTGLKSVFSGSGFPWTFSALSASSAVKGLSYLTLRPPR